MRDEVYIQAPASVVEEARRLHAAGLYTQALQLLEANSLTYELTGSLMEVRCTASRKNQMALLRRRKVAVA